MTWRVSAAGFIIATAISVAMDITFWPSFLMAGIALVIDAAKAR